MGNAAGGLPYEINETIEPYSDNVHWTLSSGTKRKVCIRWLLKYTFLRELTFTIYRKKKKTKNHTQFSNF